MIAVVGIPSEPPVAMVLEALADRGAEIVVVNQRRVADLDISFTIDRRGTVDGVLRTDRRHIALRDIEGIYLRPMEDTALPEIRHLPSDDPLRAHSARFHADLLAWADNAPGRVLNRSAAQASNGSKPFQAQIIARHGFSVPTTMITNDPDEARAFVAEHGRVVYKSISGVRSIVQAVTEDDVARLDQIRICPVQFQAWVPGVDVRAHVVGDRVFATMVTSTATDYRYAARQVNQPARLDAGELPDDVAQRCVRLAADLGLGFAGIDLRIDGTDISCFEVNPSPGFSWYEENTGQPIAAAVADHLCGE